MKLKRVKFRGYKRLADTGCNVDARVVAFVGPNESGKSSLLRGLYWLTDGRGDGLSPTDQNRRHPPAEETSVVRALFRLDSADRQALIDANLGTVEDLAKEPIEFRLAKRANGDTVTGLTPTLRRNPAPFTRVQKLVRALTTRVAAHAELDVDAESEIPQPADASEILGSVVETLGAPDAWNSQVATRLRGQAEQLAQFGEKLSAEGMPKRSKDLGASLASMLDQLSILIDSQPTTSPSDRARTVLLNRAPEFVMFSDTDRAVESVYNLADEDLRNNPPAPLRNLLAAADTDVPALWSAVSAGNAANLRTLEGQVNRKFAERIGPVWSQSSMQPELTVNQDGRLEVNIYEVGPDERRTPIGWRSDGLLAFLAVVCFILSKGADRSLVLLIDEAERNLHYDAQYDLVKVLSRDLRVDQIIYTTHSPGCLPLDMGRGVRVVQRDEADDSSSHLVDNFWTDTEPGFSRLLFAMGAQAAAFSAFRRAVLTEGVSEMTLLPTMIRKATGEQSLDYQVAFGLSNMSIPSDLGSVALLTAYLFDGDEEGDRKKKKLRNAGVPSSHMFQLPRGKALEDLVDRRQYLDVVDSLLAEKDASVALNRSSLDKNLTVAKAVDVQLANRSIHAPGHKVVAHRLAELGDELRLTTAGRTFVRKLHDGLEAAFTSKYEISGNSAD